MVAETIQQREGVVALGGGALTDAGTRALLAERAGLAVVHLDVSFDEALRRIGEAGDRPMLRASDPADLYRRRRPLYEGAATFSVATDGKRPDATAREIAALLDPPQGPRVGPPRRDVTVATPGGGYEVVVGAGLLDEAAGLIPVLERAEKAFVLTHPEVRAFAEKVARSLERPAEVIEVPAGERSKSIEQAGTVFRRLAAAAAHRSDVVIGVGGGVITDLAGFVASTFNRGMPVAHVPTSLLAQVDAAVGGKTGVNLPEGKNLVGTFHQPVAVICDVEVLGSLPDEELRSGMAEVVKYGLISDPGLLDLVTQRAGDVIARDRGLLTEIVARSVGIKASFVSQDERDRGVRAVLNYGHTFGHAIEQTTGYQGLRHGEAVAVGMMAAAWLGRVIDRIDDEAVAAHRGALEALGLPTGASFDLDRLEQAWKRDKKYDHGVRFVLLSRIGHAEAGITAPRDAIAEALARLAP